MGIERWFSLPLRSDRWEALVLQLDGGVVAQVRVGFAVGPWLAMEVTGYC